MRQYANTEFALKVANHAQDILDQQLLDLSAEGEQPTPQSNLGRAGATLGMRAERLLLAMHSIDRAYRELCAVELPKAAPRDVDRRLHRARHELLDLGEQVGELWEVAAAAIWMRLPLESRVLRLQRMAHELDVWQDGEDVREVWIDHLRMRLRMDPVAARFAGIEVCRDRSSGPGRWMVRNNG